MIPRAVEIAGDGRYLKKERGFLAVYHAGECLGRIPLDDLGMVLATGHGLTYSNNLLLALAQRGVPLVVCDRGFCPAFIFWPVLTKKERKEAGAFRTFLMDLGFERAQLSVYLRCCAGKEQVEGYVGKIKSALPTGGKVDILMFTDKQYANIISFLAQERKRPKKPKQLTLF